MWGYKGSLIPNLSQGEGGVFTEREESGGMLYITVAQLEVVPRFFLFAIVVARLRVVPPLELICIKKPPENRRFFVSML